MKTIKIGDIITKLKPEYWDYPLAKRRKEDEDISLHGEVIGMREEGGVLVKTTDDSGWELDEDSMIDYGVNPIYLHASVWCLGVNDILEFKDNSTAPTSEQKSGSNSLFDFYLNDSRVKSKQEELSRPTNSPFEFL